jgi:MerR family transcriptional regulator, light-induced transcriptional regulator
MKNSAREVVARRLSVRAAADFMGVSTTTIKRWCDDGLLQSSRTPGGHRRISIERLREARDIIFAKDIAPQPETPRLEVDELVELLCTGKISSILQRLLPSLRDTDDIAPVLDDLLAVAMWRVGELWAEGKLDIYEEHISTATMVSVLDALAMQMDFVVAPLRVAVGGTFQGNHDTLASKMAALAFRNVGYRAIDLGSNLPVASIVRAAMHEQASIVWICHTHFLDVGHIKAAHEQLRAELPVETRIIVGGGALTHSILRMLDINAHHESFAALRKAMIVESQIA